MSKRKLELIENNVKTTEDLAPLIAACAHKLREAFEAKHGPVVVAPEEERVPRPPRPPRKPKTALGWRARDRAQRFLDLLRLNEKFTSIDAISYTEYSRTACVFMIKTLIEQGFVIQVVSCRPGRHSQRAIWCKVKDGKVT